MNYVKGIPVDKTHSGYFSIDKKTKHLTDPEVGKKSDETDDADAYDLILKDKERLLSFEEPVRFIFSHSALREGWDSPNVFNICTLKHSDSTICETAGGWPRHAPLRQPGRRPHGSARDSPSDQCPDGDRQRKLQGFRRRSPARNGQGAIGTSQKGRRGLLRRQSLVTPDEQRVPVTTAAQAKSLQHYLIKNDYTDWEDKITPKYHEERQQGSYPRCRPELEPYREQVIHLIDSVFTETSLPSIDDDRKTPVANLNKNFEERVAGALAADQPQGRLRGRFRFSRTHRHENVNRSLTQPTDSRFRN